MGDVKEINKWIDLSVLPRHNADQINWKKSAGAEVPFIYGDISGLIRIEECFVKQRIVRIHVDGYTYGDGYMIPIESLKQCAFGRLFERKIVDSAPWLIQYLKNPNDAYKYTPQSNVEVLAICPICGCEKSYKVYNLNKSGFVCPSCSDGVSYPNKFMFNILRQTKITFKNEVTKCDKGFEWLGDYRYDFYFEINNEKYIVEMDGEFHDNYNVAKADRIKDQLVQNHGIEMIRIDCKYPNVRYRFDYIKSNILQSKLPIVLDLSDIDWEQANLCGISSKIPDAAKLWNEGYGTSYISKEIGVGGHTVAIYLKIANDCGLCEYNKEISEQRRKLSAGMSAKIVNSKPLCIYYKNTLIGVFASSAELNRLSIDLYSVNLLASRINSSCKNKTCYKGYSFERITKEQYEQYKLQQEIPVY